MVNSDCMTGFAFSNPLMAAGTFSAELQMTSEMTGHNEALPPMTVHLPLSLG